MATDASDSLNEFALPRSAAVASGSSISKPSRLEEEVVFLFGQFRGPIFRYLLSCQIPVSDAEEIGQEVFLALFRHLREGKSRANLQGWLFRVAHNAALKSRMQARRSSDRFTWIPEMAESRADPAPNPEEALAARERQDRLLAVVRALPEQDQWCLSLRAEGLRYREIAEVIGISLGSVAASLGKSLSRLTRMEQGEGARYAD